MKREKLKAIAKGERDFFLISLCAAEKARGRIIITGKPLSTGYRELGGKTTEHTDRIQEKGCDDIARQ